MKSLILTDVQLLDNFENENTFNVHFDSDKGTFTATENEGFQSFIYKLTDTVENIQKNHREEILAFTQGDKVGLGDIFLHGGHITRVNKA